MQLPELGSTKESPKLGTKDFRPVESDANAAFTQEGIVFFRNRQIGQRLVTAHVKGPYNQRMILTDCKGDGFILGELLFFAGSRRALHEQELRAEQTNPVASQFPDLRRRLSGLR